MTACRAGLCATLILSLSILSPSPAIFADELTVPEVPAEAPAEAPEESAEPAPADEPEDPVMPAELEEADLMEVAQEATEEPVEEMKPAGPRTHTVQEGDTLWSISGTYMIDPFYWPRLWDANRFIRNPDLIYPGNVIRIPSAEELRELLGPVAAPPPEPPPVEAAAPAPAPEAAPPAPTITKIIIEPPKEKPLDPALLASVGYIRSGDIATRPGALIAAKDNKVLLGEGDVVYVKMRRGMDPEEGDELLVFRNIRKIHHPKTGRYLGDLIVVLGKVEVLDFDGRIATGKVLTSYNYMLKGDPVAPYESVQLPSFDVFSPVGDEAVDGYVVDVRQDKVEIAQFDVVYIDRGIEDGVGAGSSFRVIRDGRKTSYFSPAGGERLPSREIAELEVISSGERTATAMVRKSSEAVRRGDRIEILADQ